MTEICSFKGLFKSTIGFLAFFFTGCLCPVQPVSKTEAKIWLLSEVKTVDCTNSTVVY